MGVREVELSVAFAASAPPPSSMAMKVAKAASRALATIASSLGKCL